MIALSHRLHQAVRRRSRALTREAAGQPTPARITRIGALEPKDYGSSGRRGKGFSGLPTLQTARLHVGADDARALGSGNRYGRILDSDGKCNWYTLPGSRQPS